MKTIYIILGLIILPQLLLYSQWKKITNIPKPYDDAYYLDVFFLETNTNFGWACGKNGVVARTTNGGKNWDVSVIPFAFQLESIHFVNEKVGYTSGLYNAGNATSAIFKSTDGGRTWFNVSPLGNIDVWGNYFVNENLGMTIGGGCGNEQQFYRTTDGGRSWRVTKKNQYNTGLSDLLIDNKSGIGYAVSSGWVWRTTDFGLNWDLFSNTGDYDWQEEITLLGNTFLLPYSTGCTGGSGGGGARISTDMGKTWRQIAFGIPMFGTFLHSPTSGWVVGWQRNVHFTSDAGKTWQKKVCGIPTNADLDDIWFINDTLGFVVGTGIYKYVGYNIQKPKILTSQTGPYCDGDTVILYLNQTYDNYKWSTGEISPFIKVTKSGTYWAFASHNECDSATSDPFYVTFLPRTKLDLQVSDTNKLCEGDTVWVKASGNFVNFNWSDGQEGDSVYFTRSGKFYVTAIDKNGCKTRDSISLKFAPLPSSEILIKGPNNFCIGDSTILISKFNYPTYKWIDDKLGKIISHTKELSVKESGSFRLVVENEFGCTSISKTVEITVRHDTNKFALSLLPYFAIDSTKFPSINCKKLIIQNLSWQTQILEDVHLFRNLAFSVPQSQFPIVLKPFSTSQVEVCFSPKRMGIDRDTLFIGDLCKPHIMPLVSFGVPNNYQSDSRCDIPLELLTEDIIDDTDFILEKPFPNPANYYLMIPLAYNSSNLNLEISIFNLFGELVIENYVELKSENTRKTNVNLLNKVDIPINISKLKNGFYIINVKSKGITQISKFMKFD